MPHKGKSSFTTKKNKVASFLRNGLRIICLVIFIHWILWLTSYANCVNYREAISEENVKEEEKELKEPDSKTEKYQRFTGWFNKEREKKNIEEIEEDVLSQIEEKKKKELGDRKLPRKWKEKLPEVEQLFKEKKKLEEKENKSSAEESELKRKKEEYDKKFKEAKEKTIKNIQEQLKENNLNITELDDRRNLGRQMLYDPLKFFIVSPLNKSSKWLGLNNYLFLEIIFKLVIIEIIFVLVYYSETSVMWENIEKAQNPYLSVEERDQLNLEASSVFKYAIFNGCMMLFSFFINFHPAFFDRTGKWFQNKSGWETGWYVWVVPIFISVLLANISGEFLRHGRLLNKSELKNCVAKGWVVSLVITLIVMVLTRLVGMNSVGSNLIIVGGGLVRFGINTIRVKFLGHREHFPQTSTTTYAPRYQRHN